MPWNWTATSTATSITTTTSVRATRRRAPRPPEGRALDLRSVTPEWDSTAVAREDGLRRRDSPNGCRGRTGDHRPWNQDLALLPRDGRREHRLALCHRSGVLRGFGSRHWRRCEVAEPR